MPTRTFKTQLKKDGGSFGMKLGYENGLMVITRFKDLDDNGRKGPCELSKVLQPRDVVHEINGVKLKGFLFAQAIDLLRSINVATFTCSREIEEGALSRIIGEDISPVDLKQLRSTDIAEASKKVYEAIQGGTKGDVSVSVFESASSWRSHFPQLSKEVLKNEESISLKAWQDIFASMDDAGDVLAKHMFEMGVSTLTQVPNTVPKGKLDALRKSAMKSQNFDESKFLASIFTGEDTADNVAARAEILDELFCLWDFDGNGFLELNEIRPVIYNLKHKMFPHDYSEKPVLAEDVNNKFAYASIETDPLVSRAEFASFFLELCDEYEKRTLAETLGDIRESIASVQKLLAADEAWNTWKLAAEDVTMATLRKKLKKIGPSVAAEVLGAEEAEAMKSAIAAVSSKTNEGRERREGFKRILLHCCAKTSIASSSKFTNAFVERCYAKRHDEMIESIYEQWDKDGKGYLPLSGIDDMLQRFEDSYDVLYNQDSYQVPDAAASERKKDDKTKNTKKKKKGRKTNMARASVVALKLSVGESEVNDGAKDTLAKANFSAYIETLCKGFGPAGMSNFLTQMAQVVMEVNRMDQIMPLLKKHSKAVSHISDYSLNHFAELVNMDMPDGAKLIIPETDDGIIEEDFYAEAILYACHSMNDTKFQKALDVIESALHKLEEEELSLEGIQLVSNDEENPPPSSSAAGCCIVA
eukprot:g3186.t1